MTIRRHNKIIIMIKLLFILVTIIVTNAFQNINRLNSKINNIDNKKVIRSTEINALSVSFMTSLLQKVSQSQAQSEFYFFFFGGSGALGIGFAQLPTLLNEFKYIQSLGDGKTLGGENVNCNPIATLGYPEPLKVKDVEYIISNLPSVEKIDSKGKKITYIAKAGGLERDAFFECLPNANPLATYAAFQALGKGNLAYANPSEAKEMMEKWKTEGISAFNNSLLSSSIAKYSAYAVFFFLIFIVFDLVIESGQNAFLS